MGGLRHTDTDGVKLKEEKRQGEAIRDGSWEQELV